MRLITTNKSIIDYTTNVKINSLNVDTIYVLPGTFLIFDTLIPERGPIF